MTKEEFAEHLQNAVDLFLNESPEYDDQDEDEWTDIFLGWLEEELRNE